MKIISSNLFEIPALNTLIAESKSFWDYSDEYLEKAIPIIQLTKEWLMENEGYSIYEETLVGFLGIETLTRDQIMLRHLWIHPSHIKQGLGEQAIDFVLKLAQSRNIKEIVFISEPPAEGFYLKLGAEFTGKTVPSKVFQGPLFREMKFDLHSI